MFSTFAGKLHQLTPNVTTTNQILSSALFSETYGFKPGTIGLTYVGVGVGFLLASLFGAKTADQIYKHVSLVNSH